MYDDFDRFLNSDDEEEDPDRAEFDTNGGLPLVSSSLEYGPPFDEADDEPEEIEDEEPEEEPDEELGEIAEDEEPDEEIEEPEEEPEEIAEEDEADEAEESEDEEDEAKGARAISSDLIRGHINTIILRSLYDGDKYGYEILEEIERKSHKQYSLKQPSLYSALKRLEKDGYVTSYWGGTAGGGRRKYFSLTDSGKEIAERNQTEWEYSRSVIDSLISDKDFDLDRPAPAPVDMRPLRRSIPRGAREEEYDYEETDEEAAPAEPALSEERAAFEEERARYEESLRAREEVLRAREEAGTRREQELLEREFALQAEEERREQLAREEAEREEAAREEQERLAREEAAREEAAREEQERLAREEAARGIAEAAERERLAVEEAEREAAAREEAERLEQEKRVEELTRLAAEQAREEADAKIRAEEEEARRAAEEEKKRAEEERAKLQAEIDEVERARAQSLHSGKEEQNARIVEMEPFTEERAFYEQKLKEQAAEFEAYHRRELADQEQRIREEDAEHYRLREQQMIHQNYLNLVNGLNDESAGENYGYYYGEEPRADSYAYLSKPETEREYRSIIERIYAVGAGEEPEPPAPRPELSPTPVPHAAEKPAPAPAEKPQPRPASFEDAPQPRPAPRPAPRSASAPPKREERREEKAASIKQKTARSLDGADFYDLEARAAQDGIRIQTSGGGKKKELSSKSDSLVHKGRALFFSSIIVFLFCIAEGAVALGLQRRLSLPMFYPFFMFGTGLALLLVTGLLYANRYGERALRQTGNLLVNVIVSYALCIILILIIALVRQTDLTDIGQLATYVIFPAVYFFSVVIFGVVYYLQIRPNRED